MIRLNDFVCADCGDEQERYTSGDEKIHCRKCGGRLAKLPPLFRINVGPVPQHGYYDENLDTYIQTNRHRKEVMLEQGVSEKGSTPKPDGEAWV